MAPGRQQADQRRLRPPGDLVTATLVARIRSPVRLQWSHEPPSENVNRGGTLDA